MRHSSRVEQANAAMRKPLSVFLDTSVLKASVDTRLVLVPEPKKVKWGDRELELEVYRPVFVNQNTKFLRQGRRDRFADTVALRFIPALAKEGKIDLLVHQEVFFELWGLPRTLGGGPLFYGAPIRKVEGPIHYGRVVVDGTRRDHQYEFLAGVDHPRFRELQRSCGAYQGVDKPPHPNQLVDAFHVWCAESASADYFLTLDDKLIRVFASAPRQKTIVVPITPLRLMRALVRRHPTWLRSTLREAHRFAKSGRDLAAPMQDASLAFFR